MQRRARQLVVRFVSGASMAWDEYFDSAAQGRRPTSDFEWYAIDRKGQLALLTSAGFGPVPMLVFRSKGAYYRAADYFRSLPVRGGHVLLASGPYDWSSCTKAAERGLFVYDWNAAAGQYVPAYPYKIMARPEDPLTLSDLPADLQSWVSLVRFDIEFDTTNEVWPELAFAEVNL
jgi:hypothetical protein